MKIINKNDSNIIQISNPYIESNYFNIFTDIELNDDKIFYFHQGQSNIICFDFLNREQKTIDQEDGFEVLKIAIEAKEVLVVSYNYEQRILKINRYNEKENLIGSKTLNIEEIKDLYEINDSGKYIIIKFNSHEDIGQLLILNKDTMKYKMINGMDYKIKISSNDNLFINKTLDEDSRRSFLIGIGLEKIFRLDEKVLQIEDILSSWDINFQIKSKQNVDLILETCIDNDLYFVENIYDQKNEDFKSRLRVYSSDQDKCDLIIPFKLRLNKIVRKMDFLWIFTQDNKVYRFDIVNKILDINPIDIEKLINLDGFINIKIDFFDTKRFYIIGEYKRHIYTFIFEIEDMNNSSQMSYIGHIKMFDTGIYTRIIKNKLIVQAQQIRIYEI